MLEYTTFLYLLPDSYRINKYMPNQVHIHHQNESISGGALVLIKTYIKPILQKIHITN
jgi:hypothetical protein